MPELSKREFVLGEGSKIVVSVSEWQGKQRLDARWHGWDEKKGGWKHSTKGWIAPLRAAREIGRMFSELADEIEAGKFSRKRWVDDE